MNLFDPILVAVDESEWSKAALSHAILLSRLTGARLILLTAAESTSGILGYGAQTAQSAGDDARQRIETIARTISSPVENVIAEGHPADVIVEQAEKREVGLVIIGNKPRNWVEERITGRVSRSVLQRLERPVLVVHHPVDNYTRIVAAVDDSPRAEKVAAHAATLANLSGAPLTVVTAYKADKGMASRPERFGITPAAWERQLKTHQERIFGPVRSICGQAPEEHVVVGIPDLELCEFAAHSGAEIVVAGRKGKSNVEPGSWWSTSFALTLPGPHGCLVV